MVQILDLSVENAILKETIGRGEQTQRLCHLEKSLLEEQLYSTDLKKKLQSANKQITTLKTKVKSLELQRGSCPASLLQTHVNEVERSQSMNDLDVEQDSDENGIERYKPKGGSPPSHYHLPRLTAHKQRYCLAVISHN